MRLWTLHPGLLDTKGLVAAWREGLLAKAVLKGETKGYRNHPQLLRFKQSADPLVAINSYLHQLVLESVRRGYRFNQEKLEPGLPFRTEAIRVTDGQVDYEFELLKSKLVSRDPAKHAELLRLREVPVNAVFFVEPGPIETWEVVKPLAPRRP